VSKKELQDKFKELFSQTPSDLKKKINDWCREKHSVLLPMWFSSKATPEQKEQFLNDLEDGLKTNDWNAFGIDVNEKEPEAEQPELTDQGEPEAEPVSEIESADERSEAAAAEITDMSTDKWSDDDIKDLLSQHGYKPVLEKDVVTVIVHVKPIEIQLPAEFRDAENVVVQAEIDAQIVDVSSKQVLIIDTWSYAK